MASKRRRKIIDAAIREKHRKDRLLLQRRARLLERQAKELEAHDEPATE